MQAHVFVTAVGLSVMDATLVTAFHWEEYVHQGAVTSMSRAGLFQTESTVFHCVL